MDDDLRPKHLNSFAELVDKVNAGDAGAMNTFMGEWKAYKAAGALEKYWDRVAPSGTSFDQSEAVAMALAMLDCYETALRTIAEKDGPDARLSRKRRWPSNR
ncbi:MAG: hypothetical protein ACLPWF_30175 [Bryobacteraceae bacterium]|jgi:hypothetical protein